MVLLHIAQMSHWISSTSISLEIDSSHGVRTTHGLPILLIFLPQTTSYGGTWRRGCTTTTHKPLKPWRPTSVRKFEESLLRCATMSSQTSMCVLQLYSTEEWLDWTCYQLLNCVRNKRQNEKTLLSNFNWIFLLNICEKKIRINVHF